MEPPATEMCGACGLPVYAMERLEIDKKILHKNCFRCQKCNCILRMDTYTFNVGTLYCTPHFTQMFKTKGDYDESFGVASRAKTWRNPTAPGEEVTVASDDHADDHDDKIADVCDRSADRSLSVLSGGAICTEDAELFDHVYDRINSTEA